MRQKALAGVLLGAYSRSGLSPRLSPCSLSSLIRPSRDITLNMYTYICCCTQVRDNPLYGWGNAGLQVINMTSGTWAGTILSPVAPYQSSHTQTTAIALRSLQSNGPLNRHTAFLTLRAPNGTSYLHAATLESSGSVVTPHNNVSMPALRWAWVSEVATGEIVTDPALFDSLDPEGSLEPNGSLGYLALTSNRRLYVYNATSGALLYAHEVPGRGLLPPTSRANIVPLNFKGLAVFPTANGECG